MRVQSFLMVKKYPDYWKYIFFKTLNCILINVRLFSFHNKGTYTVYSVYNNKEKCSIFLNHQQKVLFEFVSVIFRIILKYSFKKTF